MHFFLWTWCDCVESNRVQTISESKVQFGKNVKCIKFYIAYVIQQKKKINANDPHINKASFIHIFQGSGWHLDINWNENNNEKCNIMKLSVCIYFEKKNAKIFHLTINYDVYAMHKCVRKRWILLL